MIVETHAPIVALIIHIEGSKCSTCLANQRLATYSKWTPIR